MAPQPALRAAIATSRPRVPRRPSCVAQGSKRPAAFTHGPKASSRPQERKSTTRQTANQHCQNHRRLRRPTTFYVTPGVSPPTDSTIYAMPPSTQTPTWRTHSFVPCRHSWRHVFPFRARPKSSNRLAAGSRGVVRRNQNRQPRRQQLDLKR